MFSHSRLHGRENDSNGNEELYTVNPARKAPLGFTYMWKKEDTNSKPLRSSLRFISTETKECVYSTLPSYLTRQDDGLHQPPTLFMLCIQFVARHITHVDSLVNFPDQIGKLLFDAVVASGGFDKPNDVTMHVLELFIDAYDSCVLDELRLPNTRILSSDLLHQCFRCLTKLDMTHCHLMNQDNLLEILSQLTR